MTKFDNYSDYTNAGTELAQKALLTAWDSLAAFSDDLVLIGGLAIRYRTKTTTESVYRPFTIDVDFGVTLGASSGWYPSIKETLAGHGFRWRNQRFCKIVEGQELFIDLLTETMSISTGAAMVDDSLAVSVFPGIQRALECSSLVKISGENMIGVKVEQSVRVAEIGPLLVLKLNAFGGPSGRRAGKDIHDLMHLVMDGDGGTDGAMAAFRKEMKAGNRGAETAVACLRQFFTDEQSLGPMSCAAFRLNNEHLSTARRDESLILRQQCVTLAKALLEAI